MREDIKLEIGRMLLEGVSPEGIRVVVEAMERGEVYGYVLPDSSYGAFVEYGKPPESPNIVEGSVETSQGDPLDEYQCYVAGCTGEYFSECDSCGIEGCLRHISMSSKLAINNMPYSYFCQRCHDERQKTE